MSRKLDLIGKTFGKLTVLEEAGRTKHGACTWKCICECGDVYIVSGSNLRSGTSTRCGKCRYKASGEANRVDIIGQKFNKLTAIKFVKADKCGQSVWLFRCDCGNEKEIIASYVIQEEVKSCSKFCTHNNVFKNKKESYKWSAYVAGASIRGHKFELSEIQFRELITGNCHYCGDKADVENMEYNGIDQIIPGKGYTVDNTVSCCTTCNLGKNKMKYDDWIGYLDRIVKYRSSLTK